MRPRRLPSIGWAGHSGTLMTADRFAKTIGLSSRTIRSYHTRGLLPPPLRVGRTPCYTGQHLARMRQVIEFQSRGLPLEAVRALLEPDLVLGELAGLGPKVGKVVRHRPDLLISLADSGLLTTHADGGIELGSVRALLAARSIAGQGASMEQTLVFLAGAVPDVMPHAEAVLTEVLDAAGEWLPGVGRAWGAVVELAVELVRVCITRQVQARQSD